MITGRKAIGTRSKKFIAGFKLRKNMPVGIAVTFRNDPMFFRQFNLLIFTKNFGLQGLNFKSVD